MGECCDQDAYDNTFDDRFARRLSRRYQRRGLNRTQERMVGFLTDRGLEGATVLEIGGGVGELQVELLRRGAAHVTNTEISTNYESEATVLLERSGMQGRVTRRFVDIAAAPDDVPEADIVVLHRVVCCYPDYERLLSAAGSHASRMLVFSHPHGGPITRAITRCENAVRRLRGNDFRSFAHPPAAMVAALEEQGLVPKYRHRGRTWCIVGLER